MIYSKYEITLELVSLQDAPFIVKLRTDPSTNTFISPTSDNIEIQKEWIERYKERENKNQEFYFITYDKSGNKWGTTRLYNFREDKFELGSWIFLKDSPFGVAIKADILTREIAFEELKFKTCCFEVRKGNLSVTKYHKTYGPTIIGEDDLNYYFELTKDNFNLNKNKILKLFKKECDEWK